MTPSLDIARQRNRAVECTTPFTSTPLPTEAIGNRSELATPAKDHYLQPSIIHLGLTFRRKAGFQRFDKRTFKCLRPRFLNNALHSAVSRSAAALSVDRNGSENQESKQHGCACMKFSLSTNPGLSRRHGQFLYLGLPI